MFPTLLTLAFMALPGFNQTPVLAPVVLRVSANPTAQVMCASTITDWNSAKAQRGLAGQNAWGFTDFDTGRIFIHPNGCRILKAVIQNKPIDAPLTLKAGFALTLTHEAIHASGIHDEGTTECNAIHQLPAVLVRFFHVKAGKQLRAWMAAAWSVHRSDPPEYQSVC